MQGRRHTVTSADGTEIGLLTGGTGPALLLVHGGMGRLERWAPLWELLTGHWQVTAMDRRGRGSSGDTGPYRLGKEYDDVIRIGNSIRDWYPDYVETGSVYEFLAQAYTEKGDKANKKKSGIDNLAAAIELGCRESDLLEAAARVPGVAESSNPEGAQ